MFSYFKKDYMWSGTVIMGLMAGGQLGEMDRWLKPLLEREGDMNAWDKAWVGMSQQQEDLAAKDLEAGHRMSAGARYVRAAIYRLLGERQMEVGPDKADRYKSAMEAFENARRFAPLDIEAVDVASQDGPLPGWFIPARTEKPAPVVIFYSGLDVTKELLYFFIREEFARRGISVFAVDTPGVGAPLRLRNVASRPDYEVPTRAVVDYLETRSDVDHDRIGILGISLGGYYAPRGAAFEKRIKACAAWTGVWDYGALWQERWESQTKNVSVGFFQLQWIMGAQTMEEALERVKEYKLDGVLQRLTQPLLMLHGGHDQAIPVEQAHKAFAAAGSADKQLRIFSVEEGGSEHVSADEPDAPRQLIADWFAEKFKTFDHDRHLRG